MEILTDLLRAEATHRHAASIRYRMTAAKLPVMKDLDAFVFDGTPINEELVRSLHTGSFLPGSATSSGRRDRNRQDASGHRHRRQRHTRRGPRPILQHGRSGHRLEEEARIGKAGAIAAHLGRLELVVLDELGYLPFARSGGNCCSTCSASSTRRPR
jgi:hypothetical protein